MKELAEIKPLLQNDECPEIYQRMEKSCEEIEKQIASGAYVKVEAERKILSFLSSELMYDSYFIYLLSFVVKCFKKAEHMELLCDLIATSEYMNILEKKFALYRLKALLIKCPELETANVTQWLIRLENEIREYFFGIFRIKRRPKEEREQGKVLVLTHGFLGAEHPVSRSALERCVALKKDVGKQVLLVSTGEDSTMENAIPLYQLETRNRNNEFNGKSIYQYSGENIPLYQSQNPADSEQGILELLEFVIAENPEFVVYVGEQSVIADLINNFCPVLAVSTTFSALQRTHTEFVMVGRKASEEEKAQSYGEIIESLFTFKLKGKKHTYSREELKIPENRFVLAIVGTRLDDDVSAEFLDAMKALIDEGCYLLFIGKFNQYSQWCERLQWLSANSKALGMVSDVTGILACADLYVNPYRLGGGYSVAEAFDAGIPAVTIAYGDVATASGENFWVQNYSEMKEQIKRYRSDKVFYSKMTECARERLLELTKEDTGFSNAIATMCASQRYY